MIERMRNELFNLDDGNGALPRNNHRLQSRHIARPKTKQHPLQRAQISLQPNIHPDAERDVRRGQTHLNGTQRVKHKPECYAVHGCYHQLWGARQFADGVLEVVDMGAC